jgi:hypothetical protein
MTHQEFISAYTSGAVKVEVDPAGAARFLSARLLLPFVAMPVAGAGVALALVGWIYAGLTVIAAAIVVPRLIKRSASHFVFQQVLQDERVYDEATRANILRVTSPKDEG